MIVTLEYLHRRFEEFNKLCFNNTLVRPRLRISNTRSMLGSVRYKKERKLFGGVEYSGITLSISAFYDLTQEELDDTILHEMIHLWIICSKSSDDSSHGQLFRSIMNDINHRFGRNITISHKGRPKQTMQRNVQNIIAVTEFPDSSFGITRVSLSRVFMLHDQLPRYYKVKTIRWYHTCNPYLSSLPRVLKPKIYKVDKAVLDKELDGAVELKFENNKITRL